MNGKDGALSRRTFLAAGMATPLLAQTVSRGNSAMLDVDYRNLVSRGDLIYDKPAARSEEGMPVGNGRMGSLVWTTPSELRLQINRNDVYANNSATNSFFERNNDYCGGCGYVDIDFGGAPDEPFPDSGFEQHLSIYDGVLEIKGKNVNARVLVLNCINTYLY
jgi:Domain of unknown function (DUF5703)